MLNMHKHIQVLALLPIPLSTFLGSFGDLISPQANDHLLAAKEMRLDNRWPNSFVNEVFKDNILLNLAYLEGRLQPQREVRWDEVKKESEFEFRLEPDQTFAYHEDVLEKYQGKVVKTTNAHFNASEGFKSDGYLFGDGVCHLASLIYWAAKEANLSAEAPTNHNFAKIEDVPQEFGVSIYSNPYSHGSHAQQNLYITNNKGQSISFKFKYSQDKIKVSISELN